MNEAELRDLIAEDISVLDESLTLLSKEQYIPSAIGTRSFIDLYARDDDGHHVLVEIKRTDAAGREAIHEIQKYAEAVKRHLGANENEIRIILASTEWREMLVPFSRFLTETTLAVVGLELSIDGSGAIHAKPAPTVDISGGRLLAPWQDLYLYRSKQSLDSGIQSIETCYNDLGIEDYVILTLRADEPIISSHQAGVVQTLSEIAGKSTEQLELPKYEFAVVVAMQVQSEAWLSEAISTQSQNSEELQEILSVESEEERLQALHEALKSLGPSIDYDYFEIGYPAKLIRLIQEQNFQIVSVDRFGTFRRNEVLTDDSIVSEMQGDQGVTGQRFRRTLVASNRGHMSTARREIADCLAENPSWQAQVLRSLEEIESSFPESEIDVSIYCPGTGVHTVYYSVAREDGFLYVPTYTIMVLDPEPVVMYYGALEYEGGGLSFDQVLHKYFDNDLWPLLVPLSWGGRDDRDVEIFEDLGALYRSYRCDISGDDRQCFVRKNDRWHPHECKSFLVLWQEFLESNHEFVSELVSKIAEHDRGTHYALDSTNQHVESEGIVHLEISRQEIEGTGVAQFRNFFDELSADEENCLRHQGRIEFSISGYEDDSRELYEIDEVRAWFVAQDESIPWFFFCSARAPAIGLRVYVSCMCAKQTVERDWVAGQVKVEPDTDELTDLVHRNYSKLKELSDRLGVTDDESERIFREVLAAIGIERREQ